MNKYIRKCLIVYTSLALILVGMAGAAYAITATDADQYVTRSQYAVDMAHLQNKLDEQEAGLMGNINRYRSTNVKFVTYDTPTNYNTSTASPYTGGYYNGGNYYPHKRFNNTGTQYYMGLHQNYNNVRTTGNYNLYSICRLYNGNYLVSKNINYFASDDSYNWGSCIKFALPVENLPGYYLVCSNATHDNTAVYYVILVKLDPQAPTLDYNTIYNTELIVRMKKDFFIPTSDTTTMPSATTKPAINNYSSTRYTNNPYRPGLGYKNESNNTGGSATQTIFYASWKDPDTGDYMMVLKNIYPTHPNNGNEFIYVLGTTAIHLCCLIPADNVEYVSLNSFGGYNAQRGGFNNTTAAFIPHSAYIGTGVNNDAQWNYEFVDCVNGLKYWHAWNTPSKNPINGCATLGYVVHYSLPIVY